MTDHDFDKSILDKTDHRPWPMPDSPWVMTQTWHDLLFAHWRVPVKELREKVPGEFELDLFENEAWLGIVPFRMTNVAPRGIPSVPGVSEFPELNVRTYVRVGDKPGVFFFSLDAGSSVAVATARTTLNMPYFDAAMKVENIGKAVRYQSARRSEPAAGLSVMYEPHDQVFRARKDTLEYFLTERYCLYHRDHSGRPYRLDIHHPPWRLQEATAAFERNSMAEAAGLRTSGSPLLHFARRQDMVAWLPSRLEAGAGYE
jgi:uncharacterized protein YqjF (DUF2071 family)